MIFYPGSPAGSWYLVWWRVLSLCMNVGLQAPWQQNLHYVSTHSTWWYPAHGKCWLNDSRLFLCRGEYQSSVTLAAFLLLDCGSWIGAVGSCGFLFSWSPPHRQSPFQNPPVLSPAALGTHWLSAFPNCLSQRWLRANFAIWYFSENEVPLLEHTAILSDTANRFLLTDLHSTNHFAITLIVRHHLFALMT